MQRFFLHAALAVLVLASPQPEEEVYTFSPQQYPERRGRGLQASSYAPIRVLVRYGDFDASVTAAQRTYLQNTLVPAAIDWVQRALSVIPVAGQLRAARSCASRYSSGTCASAGTATCGATSAGGSRPIDAEMLDSLRVCTTCYTNGQCTGCSTLPAGAGVAADFVLFVSAVYAGSCTVGGSTSAYASTCQRDQNDRPIFGMANFCPEGIDSTSGAWEAQLGLALHELMHALGFSSTSYVCGDRSRGRTAVAARL